MSSSLGLGPTFGSTNASMFDSGLGCSGRLTFENHFSLAGRRCVQGILATSHSLRVHRFETIKAPNIAEEKRGLRDDQKQTRC